MDFRKKLKKKGFRLTSPRRLIMKQLSGQPLTISEIAKKLKNYHKKVDLVSIYRTLDLFLKLDLVSEIDFGDGKKRYELSHEDNHHHHLICDSCGKVEDIRLSLEGKMLDEVRSQSDFTVKRHALELFGFCANCQDEGSIDK